MGALREVGLESGRVIGRCKGSESVADRGPVARGPCKGLEIGPMMVSVMGPTKGPDTGPKFHPVTGPLTASGPPLGQGNLSRSIDNKPVRR
jgi:hypothetical protein